MCLCGHITVAQCSNKVKTCNPESFREGKMVLRFCLFFYVFDSLGKILDVEDVYYQEFSSTNFISNDNITTRQKKPPQEPRTVTLRISEG